MQDEKMKPKNFAGMHLTLACEVLEKTLRTLEMIADGGFSPEEQEEILAQIEQFYNFLKMAIRTKISENTEAFLCSSKG